MIIAKLVCITIRLSRSKSYYSRRRFDSSRIGLKMLDVNNVKVGPGSMQIDGSSVAGGPGFTSASGISPGARQDHLRDVPLGFEVEVHRLAPSRGSTTPSPSGKSPPWFEQAKIALPFIAIVVTITGLIMNTPVWFYQNKINQLQKERDEAVQKQRDTEDEQKEFKRVNEGLSKQHDNDSNALMSALGQIDLLKASKNKMELGFSEIRYILSQQDKRMIDVGIELSAERYSRDKVEGYVQAAARLAYSFGFGNGRVSQQGMDVLNGITGQDRQEAQAAKELFATVLDDYQDKKRRCFSIIDGLKTELNPSNLLSPPPRAVPVPGAPRPSGPPTNIKKERTTQPSAGQHPQKKKSLGR